MKPLGGQGPKGQSDQVNVVKSRKKEQQTDSPSTANIPADEMSGFRSLCNSRER